MSAKQRIYRMDSKCRDGNKSDECSSFHIRIIRCRPKTASTKKKIRLIRCFKKSSLFKEKSSLFNITTET